ncbi:hypothetical protein KSP40_PGU003952 [Platanthera guangdongensis]|uniref:Uncharacterized protein n=1 Tax=Platanthera guangdongensis TaxID=2320717 RepID=A0ABR2LQZ4_9ASPA
MVAGKEGDRRSLTAGSRRFVDQQNHNMCSSVSSLVFLCNHHGISSTRRSHASFSSRFPSSAFSGASARLLTNRCSSFPTVFSGDERKKQKQDNSPFGNPGSFLVAFSDFPSSLPSSLLIIPVCPNVVVLLAPECV